MRSVILLSLLVVASLAAIAQKHAVGIRGTLQCGAVPAKNVKVRLFRVKEGNKKDDLNQILDENTSGPSGMFHLEGNTNGFPLNETGMDPVVTIYHSCDEDETKVDKKGYRKFSYHIPTDFVNLGAKAKKTFDLGVLNIQVEYPGEIHDKKYVDRNAPKTP